MKQNRVKLNFFLMQVIKHPAAIKFYLTQFSALTFSKAFSNAKTGVLKTATAGQCSYFEY